MRTGVVIALVVSSLARAQSADPARDSLQRWHELLGSEPHVAGTPGDARVIDAIAREFAAMGLESRVHEIHPLLARPISAELEIVAPASEPLGLIERSVSADPFTSDPSLIGPGWNAYSGSGDVTAEVVYANYGTKQDFEALAAMGIEVAGKIVIARYGGNYRGFKAKFAELHGALGLIIYTDPADSGYMKGIPYPEGGWANDCCIQRGSIVTLPYQGDPLTPFAEATKDAVRRDPAEVGLPRIPVQPIGYDAAGKILSHMSGPGVPEGWQGGLPKAYRLSGGPELRVHLRVEQERAITRTANVIGTLRGTTCPEQLVIIGCHHDAWGFGAADPLAGTICLMEAARVMAEEAKAGRGPKRTVLFCAWGAEEFGIIGSSEWVEANRDQLAANAIAYINLDMASMGTDFSPNGWPSFRGVIAEAMRRVPQARRHEVSVFDAMAERAGSVGDADWTPAIGTMGGGSDHVGFQFHVGVPSMSMAAGGSKGTSYHSVYDTLPWYWKVVGEDYEPALMVTRMTLATTHAIADAPLIPSDPAVVLGEFVRHLGDASTLANERGLITDEEQLSAWVRLMQRAGYAQMRLEPAVRALREASTRGELSPGTIDAANRALIAMERAWQHPTGLPGRPWFANLFFASDEDSGYASWPLPALRAAIERRDRAMYFDAIEAYNGVLDRIEAAAAGLPAPDETP